MGRSSSAARYDDTISHVAVDAQGNIVVQGQFKDVADWGGKQKLKAGGGSDNDVVLAKYDLNGDHVWSQTVRQRVQRRRRRRRRSIRRATSRWSARSSKSVSFGEGDDHMSLGESDIFVARFTPDGKLEWAQTYGGDREDVGDGVASDAAGNTVITGWFQGTVDFGKGAADEQGQQGRVRAQARRRRAR